MKGNTLFRQNHVFKTKRVVDHIPFWSVNDMSRSSDAADTKLNIVPNSLRNVLLLHLF
jgi:hypothetical protein